MCSFIHPCIRAHLQHMSPPWASEGHREYACKCGTWGPLASHHAVRASEIEQERGRDPWDGGTELRKELLCSHLNRDRCWRRRRRRRRGRPDYREREKKRFFWGGGHVCLQSVYSWAVIQIQHVRVNISPATANPCSPQQACCSAVQTTLVW